MTNTSLKYALLTCFSFLFICSAVFAEVEPLDPDNPDNGQTPAIKDSSKIQLRSVHPKYPEVRTPTASIPNADYSQIVPCTPSNSTNCKDINGLPANGIDCVKLCIASQVVVGNTYTPTSVTPAVCPQEYAVINSFNVGPEYMYKPYDYIPFVVSLSAWNNYAANAQYQCGNMSQEYCHGSGCVGWGYWAGDTQPKGLKDVQMCNGTPAVVNMTGRYCNSLLNTDCSLGFHEWDTCGYYQECTRQAGLYRTGNTIPTSIVCSLEVATWETGPATSGSTNGQ